MSVHFEFDGCHFGSMFLQADLQLKETALQQQDDSDLEKKRREAEALLQSVGITTDVPAGMFNIICGSRCSYHDAGLNS